MNDSRNRHYLYRDSERGVLFGVCAGIAERFQWSIGLTRLATLALGWLFPVSVAVVYVMAALIVRERPLSYCGDDDERTLWQANRGRSES
jgi:phage shock protein PspC (stress-responsive transcriptional regulator)